MDKYKRNHHAGLDTPDLALGIVLGAPDKLISHSLSRE